MQYSVFNTLLDAVFVIDEHRNVVYVNDTAAQFCQTTIKRVQKGKTFDQLIETNPSFLPDDLQQITGPSPYKEVQYQAKAKNAQIGAILLSIQPLPDEKDKHWIIFGRDLSLEASLQKKYKSERGNLRSALVELEMAKYDPLTGIYHKGIFQEEIKKLFLLAKERNFPLSLVMFDIDNFKQVNDEYGHLIGDIVLREISIRIKATLRKGDIFARVGGEEFSIIITNVDLDLLEKISHRICQAINSQPIQAQNHQLPVTISIGAGQLQDWMKVVDEFIHHIDKATYQSKNNGKNQVTLAQ